MIIFIMFFTINIIGFFNHSAIKHQLGTILYLNVITTIK